MRCQNCRYWHRVEDWEMRSVAHGNGKTECRRLPPMPSLKDGEWMERVFPMPRADDWCGEFAPRKEEP